MTSPGRAILAGVALAAVFVTLVIGTMMRTYVTPMLSSNEMLNRKAAFLRREAPIQCDVVLMGSSVVLNGVDGAAMENALGRRVLNAGYWAASPQEAPFLYDGFRQLCRPRVVVMGLMYEDLHRVPQPNVDWPGFSQFLSHRPSDVMANYARSWLRASAHALAPVLDFDRTGSQMRPCRSGELPIDEAIPERIRRQAPADPVNLAAIDELLTHTRADGVVPVVVRLPIRPDAERSSAHDVGRAMWSDLASLVAARGGRWLDLSNDGRHSQFTFTDVVHLDQCGASQLTNELVPHLRTILATTEVR